ncbi:hypothetical protein [Mariniblastus fucicola]|nr:hypothetical protein [Mariniblastus fucicola]
MKISSSSMICLTVALAIVALPDFSFAQEKKRERRSFDVEKFLTRLDTNKNGKVDPDEIKDERTRGFLKRAGVDPNKPVSIKNFSKQVDKRRNERANPRPGQQSMGFAVGGDEREQESGDSLRFVVTDEEREPIETARTRKFSEGAKKMLDWVLKSYDKDKDGKIGPKEIKAGRWSDPPAHVSDTNKDGSLSRMELLVRYEAREEAKTKRSSERSSRRTTSSTRDRGRGRDRGRERETRSRRDTAPKTTSKGTAKTTSSTTGSRDVRKGYESYVDGLFKTYDKDKNGKLDKKEIEGMRRKPDMKADTDGDKVISKTELIDSYLEKAGQGRSKQESSKRSGSSRSSGRTSSSALGSGSPNARPPLTDKDANQNGQIEMAEFAETWTLKEVEAFYAKDKNKDGVITASEWNGDK